MADSILLTENLQETVVSVGTESTAVLAKSDARRYLQLINDSDSVIYISIKDDTAAALNTGTRLNANGGAIVFDRVIPSGSITAISSGANKKLLVTYSGADI